MGVKARIYFFFFCPRIANLLSLFYTGKGFFLFFRFSAVGQVFTPYYRGGKRREEDGRGRKRREADGKRRQAEAGGMNMSLRSLCRLPRRSRPGPSLDGCRCTTSDCR